MLGLDPLGRSDRARGLRRVDRARRPARATTCAATLDVEHGRYVVRPHPNDGARGLVGVDGTNALIVVPESTTHVEDGDAVEVMVLERKNG